MIDLSIIDADQARMACGATRADEEWQLDADGLEHRRTGYFIAREALGARRRDGLWEWPLHLAEKRWCAPRAFHEAFLVALDRFGIERDASLSHSFAVGFGMRMGSSGPAQTGFVALGDLVRPKPVARKRAEAKEARSAARGRMPTHARVSVGARA